MQVKNLLPKLSSKVSTSYHPLGLNATDNNKVLTTVKVYKKVLFYCKMAA